MADIQMHRIPSKALDSVGYDPDSHVLRIRFRHQGLYDYADVPESVYLGLRSSAHPWAEWGAHIKATYLAVRLE